MYLRHFCAIFVLISWAAETCVPYCTTYGRWYSHNMYSHIYMKYAHGILRVRSFLIVPDLYAVVTKYRTRLLLDLWKKWLSDDRDDSHRFTFFQNAFLWCVLISNQFPRNTSVWYSYVLSDPFCYHMTSCWPMLTYIICWLRAACTTHQKN